MEGLNYGHNFSQKEGENQTRSKNNNNVNQQDNSEDDEASVIQEDKDQSEAESGFEEISDDDFGRFQNNQPKQNLIPGVQYAGQDLSSNDDVRHSYRDQRFNNRWGDSTGEEKGIGSSTTETTSGAQKHYHYHPMAVTSSVDDLVLRQTAIDSVPRPIPITSKQYSLKADMMFGWKPKINVHGAPIPLYFDYERMEEPLNKATNEPLPIIYQGVRFKDSLEMHKAFANKVGQGSYKFKLPPNMNVIEAIVENQKLVFDSNFECGNLDMVAEVKPTEYDLYMRADSNTKGHHQWFFFSVRNGWVKGGENIQYKLSKLSSNYNFMRQPGQQQQDTNKTVRNKKYFQVTFEYDFKHENDLVYFSYCVPYTFTQLSQLIKSTILIHQDEVKDVQQQFIKEQVLCQSLSGLEVPLLTVTSRVNNTNYDEIDQNEFVTKELMPLCKYKKTIVVCARVHPGESNSSYIMQGFIKFITSDKIHDAIELRKRIIFKIVPISNPDGVIVGNYRTSMSGNDLNRQFISPNTRLHPTVCAIKQLIQDTIKNAKEPEPISAFIDIHGHSRKKSMFIYGPYFPLHNEKYIKMRVLPQLISEQTDMFRFYSCKFRIQKSKLKAARVVLWKEFHIMNCFTLEASFHGYLDKDRQTVEFTTEMFEKMGKYLGHSFLEYLLLVEEDEKQHLIAVKQIKNKKKKLKAHDIAVACSKQQEQPVNYANLAQQEGSQAKQLITKDKEIAGRSHSSNKDQKNSSNTSQAALQKRAQSFNNKSSYENKDQGPNAVIQSVTESKSTTIASFQNPTSQIGANNNNQAQNINLLKPQTAIQYQQIASANHSRRSSAAADKSNTENMVQGKRPFIIKKQKQKSIHQYQQSLINQPTDVQNDKRTLKQIYKKLKGDIKRTQLAQASGKYQDCMDEEDEDEYASSCDDGGRDEDGDESRSDDDLSDNDMEQLQGDILNAIDRFNQYYNQTSVQAKKQKKKSKKDKSKAKKQDKIIPYSQLQQKDQPQQPIWNNSTQHQGGAIPIQIPIIKLESQNLTAPSIQYGKQNKNSDSKPKNNFIIKYSKKNAQNSTQGQQFNDISQQQPKQQLQPLSYSLYNKFMIESQQLAVGSGGGGNEKSLHNQTQLNWNQISQKQGHQQSSHLGIVQGEKLSLSQHQAINNDKSSISYGQQLFVQSQAKNQGGSSRQTQATTTPRNLFMAMNNSDNNNNTDTETFLYKAVSNNVRNLFKQSQPMFNSKRNNMGGVISGGTQDMYSTKIGSNNEGTAGKFLQESKSQDKYDIGLTITTIKDKIQTSQNKQDQYNNLVYKNLIEQDGELVTPLMLFNKQSQEDNINLGSQSLTRKHKEQTNNRKIIIVNTSKSSRLINGKPSVNMTPTNMQSLSHENDTNVNKQRAQFQNQAKQGFSSKRPSTNNFRQNQRNNNDIVFSQHYAVSNQGQDETQQNGIQPQGPPIRQMDDRNFDQFLQSSQFKSQTEKRSINKNSKQKYLPYQQTALINNKLQQQPQLYQEPPRDISSPHSLQHKNFFNDDQLGGGDPGEVQNGLRIYQKQQKQLNKLKQQPRRNIAEHQQNKQQKMAIAVHDGYYEKGIDQITFKSNNTQQLQNQKQLNSAQNKNYLVVSTNDGLLAENKAIGQTKSYRELHSVDQDHNLVSSNNLVSVANGFMSDSGIQSHISKYYHNSAGKVSSKGQITTNEQRKQQQNQFDKQKLNYYDDSLGGSSNKNQISQDNQIFNNSQQIRPPAIDMFVVNNQSSNKISNKGSTRGMGAMNSGGPATSTVQSSNGLGAMDSTQCPLTNFNLRLQQSQYKYQQNQDDQI